MQQPAKVGNANPYTARMIYAEIRSLNIRLSHVGGSEARDLVREIDQLTSAYYDALEDERTPKLETHGPQNHPIEDYPGAGTAGASAGS